MCIMTLLFHGDCRFSLGSRGRKLLMEIIRVKEVKTLKGFPDFITYYTQSFPWLGIFNILDLTLLCVN